LSHYQKCDLDHSYGTFTSALLKYGNEMIAVSFKLFSKSSNTITNKSLSFHFICSHKKKQSKLSKMKIMMTRYALTTFAFFVALSLGNSVAYSTSCGKLKKRIGVAEEWIETKIQSIIQDLDCGHNSFNCEKTIKEWRKIDKLYSVFDIYSTQLDAPSKKVVGFQAKVDKERSEFPCPENFNKNIKKGNRKIKNKTKLMIGLLEGVHEKQCKTTLRQKEQINRLQDVINLYKP